MYNSLWPRAKYKVYAVVLLAILSMFVGLCVAVYEKAFVPFADVQLHADRSGLQMYSGNRVQLRGVDVGEVGLVRLADAGGVDITLKIRPEMLAKIPADVMVSLEQLTAFGAKTVQLSVPPHAPGRHLLAGDALAAGQVTVEVNSVFDKLTQVLNTAQPQKVNAVLGGMAQALEGRGDAIGQTADVLTAYLKKLNAILPNLREDFAKGSQVANLYADVTPDLTTVLGNVTFTGRTLVDKRGELDRSLSQVTRLSAIGQTFLIENGDDIVRLVGDLLPTTNLLREYSPEFSCTLKGFAAADKTMRQANGNTVPGVSAMVSFMPGSKPYQYPENLPIVGADTPPTCAGLPTIGAEVPPALLERIDKGGPERSFPDGDNTLRLGDPPLVAQLFGPAAAAMSKPAPGQPRAVNGGGNR